MTKLLLAHLLSISPCPHARHTCPPHFAPHLHSSSTAATSTLPATTCSTPTTSRSPTPPLEPSRAAHPFRCPTLFPHFQASSTASTTPPATPCSTPYFLVSCSCSLTHHLTRSPYPALPLLSVPPSPHFPHTFPQICRQVLRLLRPFQRQLARPLLPRALWLIHQPRLV